MTGDPILQEGTAGGVHADQTKVLTKGEWRAPSSAIDAIRFWGGFTNYKHNEIGLSDPANFASASIQQSFGVGVEHYVRLDFGGFVALVDAVGGVDIDVPKLIIDYEYPTPDGGVMTVRFDPGRQHMDGERALQYARTRHQDDEYHRAGRQQQVIDALVKKLANPLHVTTWPRVWRAIQAHTDTDLSTWDMLRIAPGLLLGWPGREQRVLQREDLIGMKAGYWVPNYEQLLPWIEEHFD